MTPRITILKTGTVFEELRRDAGDFEDWIARATRTSVDGSGPASAGSPLVVHARSSKALPDPATIVAVVITGSPEMMTDHAPWMEAASRWVRELVARDVPVFGICFGHQLLAHALGGSVAWHPDGREVGTVNVRVLPEGRKDPLFGELPPEFPVHVSHSQTVDVLPAGAVRLAENDHDRNQAFRIRGKNVWGVQFHPEFDENVVRRYVGWQADRLTEQGLDPENIRSTVRPSPAHRLLQAFARVVEARGHSPGVTGP